MSHSIGTQTLPGIQVPELKALKGTFLPTNSFQLTVCRQLTNWLSLRTVITSERCRRPHRASALSGERFDHRLGDRVGVLVEREVAGVEIAQVGRRQDKRS